jgi:hypothetical protein
MKTKECPTCAMPVDSKSRICPVCKYEFRDYSMIVKIVAAVLVLFFLYEIFS